MIALIKEDGQDVSFIDIANGQRWFPSKMYKQNRLWVNCPETNTPGIANTELIQQDESGTKLCWIYKVYFPDEVEIEEDEII